MNILVGHSKKYQNFPIVLGWKFKGNGQVSKGNSRETEVSISPLGNYGNCVRFPKISQTRNVVKFHYFLQHFDQTRLESGGVMDL